jgi:hypothetical protein
MYSIAETLESLAEHLPDALVSPAAYDRVRRAAERLPAPLSSRIYLECRLADGTPRVDLILGVDREGAEVLAGEWHPATLPGALGRSAAWSPLASLCREWSRAGSALSDGVERLWIELDLEAAQNARADDGLTPGVFVNFSPEGAPGRSVERRLAAAEEAVGILAGAEAERLTAPLARCFGCLPEGAAISYVGVFAGRRTGASRLCVQGLGPNAVAEYLAAIGHTPTAVASIHRTVRSLLRASGAVPTLLHVDVGGDGIVAGLEYSLSRLPQLRGQVLETGFLDELVRRGLCAPHKRTGLSQWPGTSIEVLRHALWPSGVWRRVNHVKLVFTGHGPVEAKAYLYVRHAYDRRLVRRAGAAAALPPRRTRRGE